MIHPERVRKLNERSIQKGRFILYWMQASQRVEYNHALEYAMGQEKYILLCTQKDPRKDEPREGGFAFVDGLAQAMARARAAAGDRDVHVMGGADLIRQALGAGYIDEFTLTIAPVVLGHGKRLFEGFDQPLAFEHISVLQSPFATHLTYRVVRGRR